MLYIIIIKIWLHRETELSYIEWQLHVRGHSSFPGTSLFLLYRLQSIRGSFRDSTYAVIKCFSRPIYL